MAAKHIQGLDGLRGLAVLMVLAFHSDVPLFVGGFIGVDIFFVLSGFLITRLLIAEYDAAGSISLRSFYWRRLLRLGPALLLMLVTVCLLSFLFLSPDKAERQYIDSLIALAYMSNWTRAFEWTTPGILGHTWSLSVEEQFYLLWPLVLLGLLKSGMSRAKIVTVAIAIGGLSWAARSAMVLNDVTIYRVYNGTDTHADGLMIGCAIGAYVSSPIFATTRESCRRMMVYVAPAALAYLLAQSLLSNWQAERMYIWGFVAVEVMAGLVILGVYTGATHLLDNKALAWIGAISYGLYLWHFPIFRTLIDGGLRPWAVLAIGSAATFAASMASYRFIERPALRLKDRASFDPHPRNLHVSLSRAERLKEQAGQP